MKVYNDENSVTVAHGIIVSDKVNCPGLTVDVSDCNAGIAPGAYWCTINISGNNTLNSVSTGINFINK